MNSFNLPGDPGSVDCYNPTLQVAKPRHREVMQRSQSHTTKGYSSKLVSDRAWIKPSNLAPESILSRPMQSCLYRDDNNILLGVISKIFV